MLCKQQASVTVNLNTREQHSIPRSGNRVQPPTSPMAPISPGNSHMRQRGTCEQNGKAFVVCVHELVTMVLPFVNICTIEV